MASRVRALINSWGPVMDLKSSSCVFASLSISLASPPLSLLPWPSKCLAELPNELQACLHHRISSCIHCSADEYGNRRRNSLLCVTPFASRATLWIVHPPSNTVSDIISYIFHVDYIPADLAPLAFFSLIKVGSNHELHHYSVRHYCEDIEGGILFQWHFLKDFTRLVVIEPIITLELHEYTMLIEIQVYTNLFIRLFSLNVINFL